MFCIDLKKKLIFLTEDCKICQKTFQKLSEIYIHILEKHSQSLEVWLLMMVLFLQMKIQFIFQIPALWDLVRKQKAIDEQLHVLPHYAIDTTDPETGSKARHFKKLETGALEVVQKFERKQILRSEPIRKKCKAQIVVLTMTTSQSQ